MSRITGGVKDPVRVLLLEVPQLLRGFLEREIRIRSDCRLLKSTTDALEPERDGFPDVVVLGLSAPDDWTLVPGLFARWPSAQVMTVTQTGEEATVWEMRPRPRSLGQMSPEQIVSELYTTVNIRRELAQE